jgi:hypothetical protein
LDVPFISALRSAAGVRGKASGRRRSRSCQDNTASPVSFGKQLREGGGFAEAGLKATVDKIFTPAPKHTMSAKRSHKEQIKEFLGTNKCGSAILPASVEMVEPLRGAAIEGKLFGL